MNLTNPMYKGMFVVNGSKSVKIWLQKTEKVKLISTVKEDLHTASITRGDISDSKTFRQKVFEKES